LGRRVEVMETVEMTWRMLLADASFTHEEMNGIELDVFRYLESRSGYSIRPSDVLDHVVRAIMKDKR
jgi:hypothetical protein